MFPTRALFRQEFYLLKHMAANKEEQAKKEYTTPSPDEITKALRKYFDILHNFFLETTGSQASKFTKNSSFSEAIKTDPTELASRAEKTYPRYIPEILRFHSEFSNVLLGSGRSIGGLKNVLGGSSRFPIAAFDGLRKFALYADTIYIPDPVLPWLETDRKEEHFRLIKILEACHDLLRIKPLIDVNLPYPAVIVFPSWEKSLETSDEQTQDRIWDLVLDFFSHYLGTRFEDEGDLIEYVIGPGRLRFREAVDKHRLLYPPEANNLMSFDEGVKTYKDAVKVWRTPEWMAQFESLPPEQQVLNAIVERLIPQFHVKDNSYSFDANPLFWLAPHFYYYRLCAEAGNSELQKHGLLKTQTFAALQSFLHPNMVWLGNVPIDDIVRLREENQNEEFRRKLSGYLSNLSETDVGDMDRVAAETIRGIAGLLAEHNKEAQRIDSQYQKKHAGTLGTTILTAGVSLYSWLAPLLGAEALLAPTVKLAADLYNEFRERQKQSRSLTGVLSEAKRNS